MKGPVFQVLAVQHPLAGKESRDLSCRNRDSRAGYNPKPHTKVTIARGKVFLTMLVRSQTLAGEQGREVGEGQLSEGLPILYLLSGLGPDRLSDLERWLTGDLVETCGMTENGIFWRAGISVCFIHCSNPTPETKSGME